MKRTAFVALSMLLVSVQSGWTQCLKDTGNASMCASCTWLGCGCEGPGCSAFSRVCNASIVAKFVTSGYVGGDVHEPCGWIYVCVRQDPNVPCGPGNACVRDPNASIPFGDFTKTIITEISCAIAR